jgi:membrane associated rhomboid family serine protease
MHNFMTIKDIWNNMLWRLIAFNIWVFVVAHLVVLCGAPQGVVAEHLALPANPVMGVTHIYTAVAYMFTQWQFLHLFNNMLWLWCFGSLMLRFGMSERTLLSAYLFGGFAGAACFMVLGALHLASGILIGSSAAILAVMAVSGVLLAKQRVTLMFFGEVKVCRLAVVVMAFTFIIDATAAGNGHIGAHIAGAFAGLVYALVLKRRKTGLSAFEQAELNRLLSKVKSSGHGSLSPNEKTRLFVLTNKNKID